jgi:hypothetical protein
VEAKGRFGALSARNSAKNSAKFRVRLAFGWILELIDVSIRLTASGYLVVDRTDLRKPAESNESPSSAPWLTQTSFGVGFRTTIWRIFFISSQHGESPALPPDNAPDRRSRIISSPSPISKQMLNAPSFTRRWFSSQKGRFLIPIRQAQQHRKFAFIPLSISHVMQVDSKFPLAESQRFARNCSTYAGPFLIAPIAR